MLWTERTIRKVMVILNDGSKFKKVEADPFKLNFKQEEKINRFLLKTIGHIDADGKHCDTYNRLHTKGSSLGIMYGLPKIHKKDTPIRPILSAINTPGYNLAQYLVPVIAPLTTSEFTVRDTFTFVEEITKIDSKNTFMASFDVKSLFTNIPLEETISIIINELFQNKEVLEVKLENSGDIVYYNKTDFKSLLDLATLENHFIFNEDIYCQVDGVAMGSPLGPTLANAFMCHLEKAFLKSFPEDQLPLIYKRYVDDVFLVFRSEEHVEPFLKFMNSLHKNIEFTCEREENNKLSFIGVDVERGEGNFVTSVFRKPTYTGLLTKFDSFIPERYKQNLISIMVYRAFHICSNYMNFHIEIEFLRDIFQKNGYPLNFFQNIVSRTLRKIYKPYGSYEVLKFDVPKCIILFPTYYLGLTSKEFSKNLRNLMQRYYPQVDIRTVFRKVENLGSVFRYKDALPEVCSSCLIYKYTCDGCNAFYIGKTERNFWMRICEHRGISFRTGKQLSVKPFSDIRNHHLEKHNNEVKFENFEILDKVSSKFSLNTLETLYQKCLKPNIGTQEQSTPIISF